MLLLPLQRKKGACVLTIPLWDPQSCTIQRPLHGGGTGKNAGVLARRQTLHINSNPCRQTVLPPTPKHPPPPPPNPTVIRPSSTNNTSIELRRVFSRYRYYGAKTKPTHPLSHPPSSHTPLPVLTLTHRSYHHMAMQCTTTYYGRN